MTRPYRTPTPTESPVFPSPPSRDGGGIFIPPDLGPARESIAMPPGIYQPVPPVDDDTIYIPPEPSYSTSSIGSPRSPSVAPIIVPGPQIGPQQQAPPPFFVHPSQPPPSQPGRTPSPRSRSRTPPPVPGQPTIIVPPPQPGAAPPAVPLTPSTQRFYDQGPDQPVLLPQPQFQVGASPRPSGRSPSEFGDRRGGPQQSGQPIIIHPPAQTHITHSPYGAPGTGLIIPPSHPPSRSTTPTTESPGPVIPTVVPGAPFPGASFPGGAPFPGAPLPGAPLPGVPFPMPGMGMPGVGMPGMGIPTGGPPITVVAPSRGSPEAGYRSPGYRSPEYRSPRESPRLFPESRPVSRYAEGPYQPIPPPVPIPTVHIEPEPYRFRRGARYPESRTPTSPSIGPEEREVEPRRDYRSPGPEYPVPVGVGPEYDRGVGPTVIQPPPVTHVHQYPSTYRPSSRTGPSPPFSEREGEPLPHPFGPPTQYPPTDQAPLPVGRPPTRSRAPTIVEVTGPEPIQVYPPPDHRPRTEPARKRCLYP